MIHLIYGTIIIILIALLYRADKEFIKKQIELSYADQELNKSIKETVQATEERDDIYNDLSKQIDNLEEKLEKEKRLKQKYWKKLKLNK